MYLDQETVEILDQGKSQSILLFSFLEMALLFTRNANDPGNPVDYPRDQPQVPLFFTGPSDALTSSPWKQYQEFRKAPPCTPKIDRSNSNKLRPADTEAWWRANSDRFPLVYDAYREWCCSPGAATSVERLWSKATRIDDRLRCRLSPDMMEALLFMMKNQ